MKKILLICCMFLFVAGCGKTNPAKNNVNSEKKTLIKKVLPSGEKNIQLEKKIKQNSVPGF